MITVSTGYKYLLFSGEAFADMFENCVMLLYAGAKPTKPEDPPGSSPIARVTAGGGPFAFGSPTNGLNWSLSTSGYLLPSTANWTLTGMVDGRMLWGRLCQNDDPGTLSYASARVDFDVFAPGDPGDGFGAQITHPDITVDEQRAVDFSIFGIPPLS